MRAPFACVFSALCASALGYYKLVPTPTPVAEVWPQPISFTSGSTALALTPGTFTISCGSPVCPQPLQAAFSRYQSLIFINTKSGKAPRAVPGDAATLPGLRVNVAQDAALALGVDESYTLTVHWQWGARVG